MNIITAISSLKKAFSYFLRLSPRTLVYKPSHGKYACNAQQSQIQLFHKIEKSSSSGTFKYKLNGLKEKEDFRQVKNFPIEGPQTVNIGNIDCQILHRVAVRSIVQAVHTTESRELSESEFELINTTHSSLIESDEHRLVST